MSLALGVDVGTTSTKALVIDDQGRIVAKAERRSDLDVAGGEQERLGPAEGPVRRQVDVRLLAQRLVSRRGGRRVAIPASRREALDGLQRDIALLADAASASNVSA